MQSATAFSDLPISFWAHVKFLSERLGYSQRTPRGQPKRLRRYTPSEIRTCFEGEGLALDSQITPEILRDYLNHRSDLLEVQVEPNLMTRDQARAEFERLRAELNPSCSLPMNKQKKDKRHHAYLVGIINMLTEHALAGKPFVDEPRGLIVVTQNNRLLRTFSRWMDGAYPALTDPEAVWEVKEYYGTTTFGSRVADGVYESMLDGYEFAELQHTEQRRVLHYLIVDDHFTWWDCGRSYLCRIIDMLHVGLVDEVLFGREVLTRWPEIVRTWS